METYNKLVRDFIPQIIVKSGKTPIVRVLNDEEYLFELGRKLQEEVDEYLESGEIAELADIAELIHAIVAAKHKTMDEFHQAKSVKRQSKGGFDNRIFLERVED